MKNLKPKRKQFRKSNRLRRTHKYRKRQINLAFTICRYARSERSERMCEAFEMIYYSERQIIFDVHYNKKQGRIPILERPCFLSYSFVTLLIQTVAIILIPWKQLHLPGSLPTRHPAHSHNGHQCKGYRRHAHRECHAFGHDHYRFFQ